MIDGPVDWILLAASLPGKDASSARVRLWRTLKDIGAVNLRDGVTLVPASHGNHESLAAIRKEIEADGGSAWIFTIPTQSAPVEKKLRALFDRSEAYQPLAPAVAALRKELAAVDEATARNRFRLIEKDLGAIERLDFFPGPARTRFRQNLDKLRGSIDRRFSPEEPSAIAGVVPRRNARQYQAALWATRKRLWVDRVTSAWLIRRFIDSRARFKWIHKPADCPDDAHGFDFDGAEFTHVGDLVTFEVLLAAFGLGQDAGLTKIGALVHYLDVGGDLVPEAAGFEGVLAGLRDSSADDDALLDATTPMLDALYQHFSHQR